MSQAPLPIVRALPVNFSLEEAFVRLASLPGCLWFDSAARGPRSESGDSDDATTLGRYSFLTADPVERMEATVGESDPWLKLDSWYRRLPRDVDSSLPPFQAGIAGLWGYEAATWLESIGVAKCDDLPTPAISLGLYDWTIAMDHNTNQAWIISQGFGRLESESPSPAERGRRAVERADQVQRWLAGDLPTASDRLQYLDQSVFPRDPQVFASQHETPIDSVRSNFTSQQYRTAIDAIVESIRRGDSFQVNLAQRLLVEASSASPDLYLKLRRHNPAPFGAYYGWCVPGAQQQSRGFLASSRSARANKTDQGNGASDG